MIAYLNQWIEEFILYLGSEKGLAPTTLQAYRSDLTHFHRFLIDKEVTQEALIAYFEYLQSKGYQSSSLARFFITLKLFFQFLKREEKIEDDFPFFLSAPKSWQKIPKVITYDEVKILLEQPDTKTLEGMRDQAILELLYSTGIRVSELCSLNLYDVDDQMIRVTGKGNKQRQIPIGSFALNAIDAYLAKYRHDEKRMDPPLFVTSKNTRITRNFVWKMVKSNAKKAGLSGEISPHTLRHCFATHLLEHGADLRIIQELLGHADIGTTDRYTHISMQKMESAFNQFHPRP